MRNTFLLAATVLLLCPPVSASENGSPHQNFGATSGVCAPLPDGAIGIEQVRALTGDVVGVLEDVFEEPPVDPEPLFGVVGLGLSTCDTSVSGTLSTMPETCDVSGCNVSLLAHAIGHSTIPWNLHIFAGIVPDTESGPGAVTVVESCTDFALLSTSISCAGKEDGAIAVETGTCAYDEQGRPKRSGTAFWAVSVLAGVGADAGVQSLEFISVAQAKFQLCRDADGEPVLFADQVGLPGPGAALALGALLLAVVAVARRRGG